MIPQVTAHKVLWVVLACLAIPWLHSAVDRLVGLAGNPRLIREDHLVYQDPATNRVKVVREAATRPPSRLISSS